MLTKIPYHNWINSQLSIAQHYGGIDINWKTYIVDYIFCEKKDWLCFPDLVEESEYERMMNENKQKVKEYYEEWKRRKEKQKEKQKEDQTILF